MKYPHVKKGVPLVSIIIPVYNAGILLHRAVMSILSQTYSHIELIIIDDGCTDDCISTITDIDDSRISILHKKNSGKAAAMNFGFRIARGEYLAMMDADDESYPRRIFSQVEVMKEKPHLAAVFTGNDLIINNKKLAPRFQPKNELDCHEDIIHFRMPAHDPTSMFRASMVKNISFNESLDIFEGLDYILKVGERYDMFVIGDCLYSYRIHANSISRRRRNDYRYLHNIVINSALERRSINNYNFNYIKSKWKSQKDKHNSIYSHFIESVIDLRYRGRYKEALKTAKECIKIDPFNKNYYKPLCLCLLSTSMFPIFRRNAPKTSRLKSRFTSIHT